MIHVFYANGHGIQPSGRHDPGAVSADGRWNEQSAGDHITAAAAAASRSAGLTVTHEAFTDDHNYVGTTRRANELGVDLVVEIHHDWNRAPEGAFVHWHPSSSDGRALADHVLEAIGAAGFPLRRDWHKPRGELYILRNTRMPAVLVEVGRIGQASIDEAAELEAMGRAIAAGVHAHLGVTPPSHDWPELSPTDGMLRLAGVLGVDVGTRLDPADVGRIVTTAERHLGHAGAR